MTSQSPEEVAAARPHLSKHTREILIRQIENGDAEAAARLSGELGYPAHPSDMLERIKQANSSTDRVVYVALVSNLVVGWVELGIVHHLATGASGEITGLVVSDGYRSAGIGRKLVAHAEQWVRDHAVTTMIVRSRITREAAHRFYIREGYALLKTSATFSKQLTL
ncbi:MAG TPA: GNAT family N-acetyltransferase [Bryobacteraceae bacterium]|jgi:GNAT superfamily N-acetyltransferase|nr:GNAT family N-acetyltransferase [Bryobacteraceae bacterium]